MLSIQQLIKALRKLQGGGNSTAVADLAKYLKNASSSTTTTTTATATTASTAPPTIPQAIVTSLMEEQMSMNNNKSNVGATKASKQQIHQHQAYERKNENTKSETRATDSSQNISQSTNSETLSQISHSDDNGSGTHLNNNRTISTKYSSSQKSQQQQQTEQQNPLDSLAVCRSQQIQNFYQQQLLYFHTQQNSNLQAKQKQIQFSMSSLAAAVEPLALKQKQQSKDDETTIDDDNNGSSGTSCNDGQTPSGQKTCFNTAGIAEMLQFMELIGNLKHTKRTGWVLRDVNDCESISGHMYRMSMMTFLLDGSEGLNQIRCMELALVHDLAESLVGDITPFCGITKTAKREMEFKAMDDICKLIEPRGKRIMELFEEYELGESAESRFVKDLDRLDMVLQAFEYEKRDNCLLKHQEFFDSTEGKFNHPFVKKFVEEICAQRLNLAKLKGATPPPSIHIPVMGDNDEDSIPTTTTTTAAAAASSQRVVTNEKQQTSSNSS